VKYCRNKGNSIILTQIGGVVSETQPKKLEVAISLKRCKGWTSFVEVLEAAKILACSGTLLKSRFKFMGKSAITLYISLVLTGEIVF